MPERPQREINPRGAGDRLRAELMDAALRLFETTRGDGELTLRGVAREAGVAAPSVYTQFASANDLALAVLERVVEVIGERVFSRAADAAAGEDRVRSVALAYAEWAIANPGHYTAVMQGKVLRMVDDGASIGREHTALMVNSLVHLLGEAENPPADLEFAAYQLWTSLHGIVSLRIAKPYNAWPALDSQVAAAVTAVLGTR